MQLIETIDQALKNNDKPRAVEVVIEAFEDGMDVVTFYEKVLTEILNRVDCDQNDADCIWLEHQMSSIAQTLVEITYPYVIKQKRPPRENKHALIVCPKNETHELGALMGAHMFELVGFKTTYIGANTPVYTIESAINTLNPTHLVLSVSNAYHLFEVDKVITRLRANYKDLKLIGAGRAFTYNKDHFKASVDALIESFETVKHLASKGEK